MEKERYLLVFTRTFLLGYFGEASQPETVVRNGRIDFKVGDVAVEFVVRAHDNDKNKLLPRFCEQNFI